MRRVLPLLAALCMGCGEPPELRVVLFTQEQTDAITSGSQHEDVVREAAGILGLDVTFTARRRGAVVLDVHDGPTFVTGRALQLEGCTRVVWASPVPVIVAHELGHALGLEHSDEPNNLMREVAHPDNVELTPLQDAEITRGVRFLRRC